MSYRKHLFSLSFGHALRESLKEQPYSWQSFSGDLNAGITVGIIAIPLSMALAIASGVPPQYGLYTAIVAGLIIALTGGSRYSVSGPTAAFVVILYPIAEKFGLAGLLLATLMSGFILLGMAFARLGRLIEYIPSSVTLGFTTGIAIVIATLQIKDFLGLDIYYPENYLSKISAIFSHLHAVDIATLAVGLASLLTLIYWRKISRFPAHIPALLVGVALAYLFSLAGFDIETIGSRFSYSLANGEVGQGIPPFLPQFILPWQQVGADGQAFNISWALIQALLPAAFSIAMLGAIESLLCAVVLDNMTNTRHSANSELLGQGLGNIIAPFFGGITATAAIARSGANLRAGAKTPIAAIIHSLIVLAGLLILAPLLAYLPMSSMAAILLVVTWNIAEVDKVKRFIKSAPSSDIVVLVTCLSLTVLIDMVIAIAVGVVLAALLFMREISELTKVTDISDFRKLIPEPLKDTWHVYKINGPLFFAAAERIFAELSAKTKDNAGVILYMDAMNLLDAGGLAALHNFITLQQKRGVEVIITDLQFQPLKTIARSTLKPINGELSFYATLAEALQNNTLQIIDDNSSVGR